VGELRAQYVRQVRGWSRDGRQRWLNWVVLEEPDGRAVGFVQATAVDGGGRIDAELAWVIGVGDQGRGLATEATAAVRTWLGEQGTDGLSAHIHPDHVASGRVAGRLGLTPSGATVDGEVVWVGSCAGS
jgi:RimJ/RimL family protein N-acetyltransferase